MYPYILAILANIKIKNMPFIIETEQERRREGEVRGESKVVVAAGEREREGRIKTDIVAD